MVPGNYQEWIELLKKMREKNISPDEFEGVENGTISEDASTLQRFQIYLIETVNIVLNRTGKNFLKNINESLETNEIESLYFLFRRFYSQVWQYLFFEKITFLSQGFKDELSSQIIGQMGMFEKEIIEELRKIQEESNNPELEDMIYTIQRMKGFKNHKRDGKLQHNKTGS